MQQYRITPGGWPAFSEERGVNKKEVPETFDWLPGIETSFYGKSDRYYLEDCRDALERVEGAKEWLKANDVDIDSESADIYWKIAAEMTQDHSGASGSTTLRAYKELMADWDGWVYMQKRVRALLAYRAQQPPAEHLEYLIAMCKEWEAEPEAYLEHEIKYDCGLMCISGCVTELRITMEDALEELRGPPLEASPPAPPINFPFLPLGAHLLPQDFQAFLKGWNLDITKECGAWLGEERKEYKKLYPERWAEFLEENARFTEMYGDAVDALKLYQALNTNQPD